MSIIDQLQRLIIEQIKETKDVELLEIIRKLLILQQS